MNDPQIPESPIRGGLTALEILALRSPIVERGKRQKAHGPQTEAERLAKAAGATARKHRKMAKASVKANRRHAAKKHRPSGSKRRK
jgi:hypothetical protein